MNEGSRWFRPTVFLLSTGAWGMVWLVFFVLGALSRYWEFGVGVQSWGKEVFSGVALRAVPLGIATPILLHGAERLARRHGGRKGFTRLAPWWGISTVVHVLLYVSVRSALSDLSWISGLLAATTTLGPLHVGVAAVGLVAEQRRAAVIRERMLLRAQLSALRAQLEPHFLFNTLQAIGAMARSDADATVRMTALLGDLLRQSLRERRGDLVTLADERDLLLPYVELQRLRFGDRLTIELDLADDVLDAEVPDLVLQPLVENALRHGIEATPGAGTVVVRARRDGRDLVLQVVDDGAGPPVETIDGVGLGTTRARLQGLFGSAASLTMAPAGVRGTTVTVRLPLRLRRSTRAA